MSQHDLTRWIEDADARQFSEAAMFDRRLGIDEGHFLHLGDVIAKVPSWFRQSVTGKSLAAVGCHAIAYVRHQQERKDH